MCLPQSLSALHLNRPGAHWFNKTNWPARSWNSPVLASPELRLSAYIVMFCFHKWLGIKLRLTSATELSPSSNVLKSVKSESIFVIHILTKEM